MLGRNEQVTFIYDGIDFNEIDINYPGASQTYIRGINNAGIMIGNASFYDPGGGVYYYGFYYDGTSFIDVIYPGATQTTLTGINDNGQIVGWARPFDTVKGFIYSMSDGSFTDLIHPFDTERPWSLITEPYDINNNGVVVGSWGANINGWNRDGFLFDGTNWYWISYPSDQGPWTHRVQIYGINDFNQFVGCYRWAEDACDTFLFDGIDYIPLIHPDAFPSGEGFSSSMDINNIGEMVGSYKNEENYNGLFVVPKPECFLDNIIDTFETCVTNGSIIGSGSGNSANKKLNALKKKLESVSHLIADGDNDGACQELLSIYKKCDGQSKPKDFITGDSDKLEEMQIRLRNLMISLDCE